MGYAIDAFSWKPLGFLFAVGIVPLLGSGIAAYVIGKGRAGSIALLATVLLSLLILIFLVWQMRAMRATVADHTLSISAGLYRQQVPLARLQLDQAQLLPASDLGSLIKWRRNGIGMAGLQAGWFSGSQGKVFAAIGNGGQAVLLPTDAGYSVVITVEQPQALLQALRAAQQASAQTLP